MVLCFVLSGGLTCVRRQRSKVVQKHDGSTDNVKRERQRQIVLVLTVLMWYRFVSFKVTLPAAIRAL